MDELEALWSVNSGYVVIPGYSFQSCVTCPIRQTTPTFVGGASNVRRGKNLQAPILPPIRKAISSQESNQLRELPVRWSAKAYAYHALP
jgi:hypothetical protein